MDKKRFSYRIASDTTREKVFAEIFYDNHQWAEISQENQTPIIVFFSPSERNYWEFPLEEALEALNQAKKRLLHE